VGRLETDGRSEAADVEILDALGMLPSLEEEWIDPLASRAGAACDCADSKERERRG
jgi:hypothetical protein